jgi:hypothetical protein
MLTPVLLRAVQVSALNRPLYELFILIEIGGKLVSELD